MPGARLELARPEGRGILSPLRLPIPPPGQAPTGPTTTGRTEPCKLTLPGLPGYDSAVPDSASDRFAEDDLVRDRARATRPKGKAVIGTDTGGRILYWNDAAEDLFGWRRDEVLNLNVVDVTPSRLSQPEAAHIMKILRTGESWSGAFEVQHRDGRPFRVAVTDSPVFNANGKLVGIIGVSARIRAAETRR